MTQCKAVTGNDVQCKNSAKDGEEYCGIHGATYIGTVMTMPKKDQYKIMILDVGAKSMPAQGGYSGQDAVAFLQKYHDDGYELFAVNSGGLHELAGSTSKDYFSVMYTLRLRE